VLYWYKHHKKKLNKMFTLSEKIRVINSPSDITVFDNTNTVVATTAAIVNGDELRIPGFGKFNTDNIVNIKCRRAVPASVDSKDFTVVAPAGVAIGDAIEVVISVDTDRYQAEVLAQNHIGNGRTIKFSTEPLTGVSAANIRTAIVAGWNSWLALFTVAQPFISVTAGVAATDIEVASTPGYESVTIKRVEIRRTNQGIGTQPLIPLAVAVVNSVGTEGKGQGKFLEESIRMATPYNTDPYGVDTFATGVDLRGQYTEVSFEYATEYLENLGTTAADYAHTAIGGPAVGGVPANHSFTLFLNEDTCLGTNGAIHKLAGIAVLRAGVLAYLASTVNAAPLSAADERAEVLIFTDESSVATSAAFIL
jgi:hypothetical protein